MPWVEMELIFDSKYKSYARERRHFLALAKLLILPWEDNWSSEKIKGIAREC